MARPRKVVESEESVIESEMVSNVEADDVVKVEPKKVNVEKLKAILWKSSLAIMQEAVADIEGDNLTMMAVEGIINSSNSGIAAQYLQQIIQRNS